MTRYDTYIELVPVEIQDSGVSPKTMQFGLKRSAAVAGFQKLINIWLKALLTEEGTDPSDRNYGTAFTQLFGSNITSREDVQIAIEFAVTKANEDIQGYQSAQPPSNDDEVLEDAAVTSIIFSTDNTRIDIRVRIENKSGRILQLQIPVTL